MKRWLYDAGDGSAAGGVLTFSAMSSGWDIDDDYQGPSLTGYHSLLKGLATDGAHALTIAGYDDTVVYTDAQGTPHTGAFIVVNSWAPIATTADASISPTTFSMTPTCPNSNWAARWKPSACASTAHS